MNVFRIIAASSFYISVLYAFGIAPYLARENPNEHYTELRYHASNLNLSPEEALENIKSSNKVKAQIRFDQVDKNYWIYISPDQLNITDEVFQIRPNVAHEVDRLKYDPMSDSWTIVQRAGRNIPISSWTLNNSQLIFELDTDARTSGILLRMKMENTVALSVVASSWNVATKRSDLNLFSFALANGALLMLGAMAMSIWTISKDSGYAWLVLCIASLLTLEVSMQGFGHFYLWGKFPSISIRVVSICSSIFIVAYIGFSNAIFKKQFITDPLIQKTSNTWRVIAGILGLNILFGNFAIAVSLLSAYSVFIVLYYTITTFWFFRKRFQSGIWVITGHASLALIFLLRMMQLFGLSEDRNNVLPVLESFHYMLAWSLLSIIIFVFMIRNSAGLAKDHLRWQGNLIQQMEHRVAERTEALHQSQEKLRISAEKQKLFLSTMSHELRTPLSSIVGLAQLQLKSRSVERGLKADLDVIRRMAIHTLSIVDDGLKFVRNQITNTKEEPSDPQASDQSVDLISLSQDLHSMAEVLAHKNRNQFSLKITIGTPIEFRADEKKVRQILINLLSNAFKYCSYGKVLMRVRSIFSNGTYHLAFLIIDSGRGMSKNELEMYFQTYSKSWDSNGLGLGLSLVASFSNELGAKIKVRSTPNKGSAFLFFLPLSDPGFTLSLTSKDISFESNRRQFPEEQGLSISDADLVRLRGYIFSGEVTNIERLLNKLKSSCDDDITIQWIISIQDHLERLDLDSVSIAIDKILDIAPEIKRGKIR